MSHLDFIGKRILDLNCPEDGPLDILHIQPWSDSLYFYCAAWDTGSSFIGTCSDSWFGNLQIMGPSLTKIISMKDVKNGLNFIGRLEEARDLAYGDRAEAFRDCINMYREHMSR
jgi:hypothetical protein